MREDAGGRLVVLLRSEVFCANSLELSGHELGHVVVDEAAVVAGGASNSGSEVVTVSISISQRHLGVIVDLRSSDVLEPLGALQRNAAWQVGTRSA